MTLSIGRRDGHSDPRPSRSVTAWPWPQSTTEVTPFLRDWRRARGGSGGGSSPSRLSLVLSVLLGLCGCASAAAAGDLLSDVNAVRTTICPGGQTRVPLRVSPALSRAARRIAQGATSQGALVAVGYAASRVASIQIQGSTNTTGLQEILAQRYCSLIASPDFSEIGVERHRDQLWLVLARERVLPGQAGLVSARALSLINDARSRPRRCGGDTFAAARALTLNALLGQTALLHSQDMATYSFVQHQGRDGSTPTQRASRAGYRSVAIAENVAAGPETVDEVIAGWLASAGHCANIMSARYREMGLGFAIVNEDPYGVYWTLSLAAPR